MRRADQKKLMRTFCNSMRDALLKGSAHWPEHWDGHELRELAAEAFDSERTRLMRERASRKRVADVRNTALVNKLY